MRLLKLSVFLFAWMLLGISSLKGPFQGYTSTGSSWPLLTSGSRVNSITLPSHGHLTGLKDYTSNSPETDNRIGDHFWVNSATLHPILQRQLTGSCSVERAGYHVRQLRKILFPFHFFW